MKWGKTIWSGSVKHLLFFAFFDIFSAFVIISWRKNAQAIRQNRIKQSEHTWLKDCAKHRGRYFTILSHSLLHCKFGVNFFDVWHGSWWTGIYNLKWILDLAILFCGWDLKCSVTQGFGVWSWIRLDWIKGEQPANTDRIQTVYLLKRMSTFVLQIKDASKTTSFVRTQQKMIVDKQEMASWGHGRITLSQFQEVTSASCVVAPCIRQHGGHCYAHRTELLGPGWLMW